MSKAREFYQLVSTAGRRGCGKTQAAIQALKALPDGILMCHNQELARSLQRQYPEVATQIVGRLSLQDLGYHNNPIILDHHLMDIVWEERERKFQAELAAAKNQQGGK